MKTLRNVTMVFLLALSGLCSALELEDVLKTEPIRTLQFTGVHNIVARCIYDRIGGRAEGAEFGVIGDKLLLYDSVSDLEPQGLNYYALTIMKTGPNQGTVEWRINRPVKRNRGTSPFPVPESAIPPLSNAAVKQFWTPVQECAEKTRNPS